MTKLNILKGSISERFAFQGPARFSQEQSEPLQWLQNEEQQQHEGSVGDANDANLNQNANNQQQQQNAEFVDPWKDVDLDLLPAEVRDTIEKGRNELKKLHGENASARKMQSQFDMQQAEIARLSKDLQTKNGQQQQQQQQKKGDPVEEMLREQYSAQGFDDATTKNLIKVNAPIMRAMQAQILEQVGTGFAPLANAVTEGRALEAFESVRQTDRLGWSRINEVQEQVWQNVQAMQKRGELVDPQVVNNLARIHFSAYVEEHGFPANGQETEHQQTQPIFRPLPPMNNNNGNINAPQFTFPGYGSGGNHAQPALNRGAQQVMDPETRAAVAATVQHWPVQPKEFKGGKR